MKLCTGLLALTGSITSVIVLIQLLNMDLKSYWHEIVYRFARAHRLHNQCYCADSVIKYRSEIILTWNCVQVCSRSQAHRLTGSITNERLNPIKMPLMRPVPLGALRGLLPNPFDWANKKIPSLAACGIAISNLSLF